MSAASPLVGLPSQHHHHPAAAPHHHHHHCRSDQPLLPPASTTASTAGKRPSTTAATAAMPRDDDDDEPAERMTQGRGGVIRLDIYVDLLCPWCFIEKHSLEALTQRYAEQHPDVRFEVAWKPYYIAPAMGKHNVDKRSIYSRLDALNAHFLSRIRVAGAAHDIAFSIRGLTGSTRPAHRLIALADSRRGDPAAQSRVVEMLFQGHFEDGRDLSDEAWLVAVGKAAAGLEGDDVREALREDGQLGRRVDEMAGEARELLGVEAVPCVMVQGRYKVGGYQEAHVFESLFEKMRLAGEVV